MKVDASLNQPHRGNYTSSAAIPIVDRDPKRDGRRAFIRLSTALTGINLLSNLTGFSSLMSDVLRDRESRRGSLLKKLFGVPSDSAALLVPAANHPFRPPSDGHLWYPLDGKCALSYSHHLFPDINLPTAAIVSSSDRYESLVLFGSPISNAAARTLLGDTKRPPHFLIRPGGLGNGWEAKLRWTFHTPHVSKVFNFVRHEGPHWNEEERVIVDSVPKEKKEYGVSRITRSFPNDNRLGPRELFADDYLLVTCLPRYTAYGSHQKIICFSGLYGPGMAASESLFTLGEGKLADLNGRICGEPFYQALFKVSVTPDRDGELHPSDLELLDAVPLIQQTRIGKTAYFVAEPSKSCR